MKQFFIALSIYAVILVTLIPYIDEVKAGSSVQSLSVDSNGLIRANKRDGNSTTLTSDYEEGTWIGSEGTIGNMTGTGSFVDEKYTRYGRMVIATVRVTGYTITNGSTVSSLGIGTEGLPGITNSTNFHGSGIVYDQTNDTARSVRIADNSGSTTDIAVVFNPGFASSQNVFLEITLIYYTDE